MYSPMHLGWTYVINVDYVKGVKVLYKSNNYLYVDVPGGFYHSVKKEVNAKKILYFLLGHVVS